MIFLLDTDMDTDCDDAGALAIAHGLRKNGEIDFAAVVCSIPHPVCAGCVAAINLAYGAASLPVGLIEIPDWEEDPARAPYREHRARAGKAGVLYNETIGGDWLREHPQACFESSLSLYRRTLAAAPDQSVNICAIGTLSALAQLLDSEGDQFSPLSGRELVRRKVALLVTMAEAWGDPARGTKDGFNWNMDRAASAKVLASWPSPILVSPWGRKVLTGSEFMQQAPEHPVAQAYLLHQKSIDNPRSSWDQLAVLLATRSEDAPFARYADYDLSYDPATGEHRWKRGGRFVQVEPLSSTSELARLVEDFMLASLEK